MIRFVLGLVALVSTAHCNRENALESPVMNHCIDLATEIDQMTQDYDARSKIIDDTLSQDQIRAVDAKYGIVPYDRRYVIGGYLARELGFCELVRTGDEQARRALEQRTASANKAFAAAVKLGDAAKALHELSALAAEVSRLPLK